MRNGQAALSYPSRVRDALRAEQEELHLAQEELSAMGLDPGAAATASVSLYSAGAGSKAAGQQVGSGLMYCPC